MNAKRDKIAYLKDKLQGWPDAMCLTSKDITDLLLLLDEKEKQIKAGARNGGRHINPDGEPKPAEAVNPSPGLPEDERALAVLDNGRTGQWAISHLRSRLAEGRPAKPEPRPLKIHAVMVSSSNNVHEAVATGVRYDTIEEAMKKIKAGENIYVLVPTASPDLPAGSPTKPVSVTEDSIEDWLDGVFKELNEHDPDTLDNQGLLIAAIKGAMRDGLREIGVNVVVDGESK